MRDEDIERALSTYTPEPRAGLEQRVINRVGSRREPRRSQLWSWAITIAVPLCLMLVLYKRDAPKLRAVIAPSPAHDKADAIAVRPEMRRAVQRRSVLPKQAVFPSPVPLTEGERALLALFRRNPGIDREANKSTLEPIAIELLAIPELILKNGQ